MSRATRSLLFLVGVAWCVAVLNHVLGYRLNVWGIVPREWHGLVGVLVAPFLHRSVHAVVWNTLPFLLLGWVIAARGPRRWFQVTGFVWLTSGLLLWGLGSEARYVGASGVVFGYLGYLVVSGLREKRGVFLLIGLALALLYGLLLLRHVGWVAFALPFPVLMPWEMHGAGVISGVLAAVFFSRSARHWRW